MDDAPFGDLAVDVDLGSVKVRSPIKEEESQAPQADNILRSTPS